MNLPAQRGPVDSSQVTLDRATELSKSRLMPEHFHNNPANVQYVMEIGRALGIDPVSALSHVHVWEQDGKLKCGLSADLMVALARSAGHIVHIKGNQIKATATLIRGDATPEKIESIRLLGLEPKDYFVFTEVWDAQRADEIGLTRKSNWKNYKPEMLKARVKSAVVRSGASEVLIGLTDWLASQGIELSDARDEEIMIASARYTPDELGADTDEEGRPLKGRVIPTESARPEPPKSNPSASEGIVRFVEENTPERVIEWAQATFDRTDLSTKERVARLHQVFTCVQAKGSIPKVTFTDPASTSQRTLPLDQAIAQYAAALNRA